MEQTTEYLIDEPLFYCGDELQAAKLGRLRSAMRRDGIEALLTIRHETVRYLTGFYAKGYRPFAEYEYVALLPLNEAPVLGTTLAGEERRARQRSRTSDVRRLPKLRNWAPEIAKMLGDYGVAEARIGFDVLPHYLYNELSSALPGAEFVEYGGKLSAVMAVKHPIEIDLLREALQIVQDGMRAAFLHAVPGNSEIAVSAAAEFYMRSAGSEVNPFIPVVASGTNAAIWERVATPRLIESGDMVIIDLGAVHKGYTGDFARTIVVGQPTAAQQRLFRAAYDAHQAALAAIRPGVACSEVDEVARGVLRDRGYENEMAKWSVGHQLGYGLHGAPLITAGESALLEPGMVINIEPAVYTADDLQVGGVEIEDTVLVTESGAELLTDFPYDDRLLG